MKPIGVFEAKTNLSKYITAIINHDEDSIVISKNGIPVAKLVPYEPEVHNRIGLAKGLIPELSDIDEFNSIDVSTELYGEGALL